jgi:hypothetical protein
MAGRVITPVDPCIIPVLYTTTSCDLDPNDVFVIYCLKKYSLNLQLL